MRVFTVAKQYTRWKPKIANFTSARFVEAFGHKSRGTGVES